MSENTKIEWAHHTFNPWEGCQKVGPGCDNCYAESRNARFSGGTAINWGPGAPRRRTSAANWAQPVRWNAEAKRMGIRYRVFCASLADVFDNAVPTEWRRDLFELIGETPHLDWLLLTKRIGNVRGMVPLPWISQPFQHGPDPANIYPAGWPSNVWIGATVVNQTEADRDIPKLLAVPAAVRFLSMEPLLGPVDLRSIDTSGDEEILPLGAAWLGREDVGPRVDWVIVGGESGPKARPMHPQWVRSLRDQCIAASVPFLFKQHGEWLATEFCDDDMAMLPSRKTVYVSQDGQWHDGTRLVDIFGGEEETAWVGKKAAGRLLDGREWTEFPSNTNAI